METPHPQCLDCSPQNHKRAHFASAAVDTLALHFLPIILSAEETKILNYTWVEMDAQIRRFQLEQRSPDGSVLDTFSSLQHYFYHFKDFPWE